MIRTRVGYAGGTAPDPTYRKIGDHMETIQIDYDPERIGYDHLLQVYLYGHDPSWPSPIRQYASAVMFHDQDQEEMAKQALAGYERKHGRKPATSIIPFTGFTRAEDYHQKYYLRINRELMARYEGRFSTEEEFTDSTAVARVNGYIGGHGTAVQLEKEAPELGIGDAAVKALRELLRKAGK